MTYCLIFADRESTIEIDFSQERPLQLLDFIICIINSEMECEHTKSNERLTGVTSRGLQQYKLEALTKT